MASYQKYNKATRKNQKKYLREILNAIFLSTKTVANDGCRLPTLPPGKRFTTISASGNLKMKELLNVLHDMNKKSVSKQESPSLGIINSKSVKTSHHVDTDRGINGNKKIKEQKKHIIIDILELSMVIHGYEANIHDSKGTIPTMEKRTCKFPKLCKILADREYLGNLAT